MARTLFLVFASAVLGFTQASGGGVLPPAIERGGPVADTMPPDRFPMLPRVPPTRPEALATKPEADMPVGKWSVEFANGVTEACEIRKDCTASVLEPVRISGGKAVVNGSSVVIVFENGRVQRWTPVGKRLVVEHWFPGSQFPTAAVGVIGIAERAP
jgi:hypothetical protein